MNSKLYIVTLYRLAERNNHSYLHGVYSSLTAAKVAARQACQERGGKYGYGIDSCMIDHETEDEAENIINFHDKQAWDADAP